MPTMHIYQGEREIAVEEFQHSFFIVKGYDRLYWGEEGKLPSQKLTGPILIWMRSVSVFPELAFILSDWQLILNGVDMSQDYQGGPIDIEGKTVDLRYNDYRFVCHIPKIEYEPESRIAKLRAMR